MSGLAGLTRHEMFRTYLEDAFDLNDLIVITISSRAEHDQIVGGRHSLYYDRGIVPLSPDLEDRCLRGAFCESIILDETEGWNEQAFLAYLVYWGVRLKIRLNHQAELGAVAGEFAPDEMVEEMVEAEMLAMGLDHWWKPLLKGASE